MKKIIFEQMGGTYTKVGKSNGMGWSDEQHPQQSHRNRKSRYNL